jgi:hypothetical protein
MRRLLGLVAETVKTPQQRVNTVRSGNFADHPEGVMTSSASTTVTDRERAVSTARTHQA